jgi:hypothetical protein
VWCALAIYPVARHWAVRVLAIAYPLATTLVVVSTGNHFFLDVIAGALLALVAWVAVTRIGAWLTVRIATRRSQRQPGRWQPVRARPALADAPGGGPASAADGLPGIADDGGPARRNSRRGGEPGGPPDGNQIAA